MRHVQCDHVVVSCHSQQAHRVVKHRCVSQCTSAFPGANMSYHTSSSTMALQTFRVFHTKSRAFDRYGLIKILSTFGCLPFVCLPSSPGGFVLTANHRCTNPASRPAHILVDHFVQEALAILNKFDFSGPASFHEWYEHFFFLCFLMIDLNGE